MDTFKIERYFTSIGRSFYVSDEFEELQKSEEIEYKPISNFGIGFLSAFMICKEMHVSTQSYDESKGLEIDIPNFDGCFFIKKSDNDKTGTSITLYEDERKLLDEKKIIDYIKTTMLDFQLFSVRY
jgi:HSP90 family molecular chaperone